MSFFAVDGANVGANRAAAAPRKSPRAVLASAPAARAVGYSKAPSLTVDEQDFERY